MILYILYILDLPAASLIRLNFHQIEIYHAAIIGKSEDVEVSREIFAHSLNVLRNISDSLNLLNGVTLP